MHAMVKQHTIQHPGVWSYIHGRIVIFYKRCTPLIKVQPPYEDIGKGNVPLKGRNSIMYLLYILFLYNFINCHF